MTRSRRTPTEHRYRRNGVELCYFEWVPERGAALDSAPTVLLAHATGFHARCWDQVVANLPEDYHVIAIDQRGHGRSDKTPPFNWASFGADMVGFVTDLNLQRIVGAGHSMGGHVMVQAAAAAPARFERLVLIDPVIMDPAIYAMLQTNVDGQPATHPTAKRNNQWQSWGEMYDRLRRRPSYAAWRDDVFEDYCRYGVLPNPDGPNWMLACPPWVEAAIYTGSTGRDIHDLFATIQIPVLVLRAQKRARAETMDFLGSPTWEALAAQFPRGRDVYLPQLTHFIPMQDPALVARFIEDHDAPAPPAPRGSAVDS